MINRRKLLSGASLAAMLAVPRNAIGAFAIFQAVATSVVQPAFSSVSTGPLVGGGGFTTGVSIANDGTTYTRCDTYGCFRLDPGATASVQLLVSSAIQLPLGYSDGAYEIACAPTNSSVMCVMLGGSQGLYYSTNKGATLTLSTGFPAITANVNGITNTYYGAAKLAFDPVNASNVIAYHPTSGPYQSTNGGQTWTAITGLTAPTAYGMVVYDPNSTSGGASQIIYLFSSGTGWYKGVAGISGSFALTTSPPTNSTFGACDVSNHTLYAGNSSSTTVNLFSGTTWSTSTAPFNVQSIAADPITAARTVAIGGGNGYLSVTTNSGFAWSTPNGNTTATFSSSGALSVAWIALVLNQGSTANSSVAYPARIAFNPANSGQMGCAYGYGLMFCTPSGTPSTGVTWTEASAGIENMVVNKIVSPPTSGPVVAVWDHSLFVVKSPNAFPSTPVGNNVTSPGSLNEAWSVDWVTGKPSTLVAILSNGAPQSTTSVSGISTDALNSITTFGAPSVSPAGWLSGNGSGGSIVASSATAIAWASGGGNSTLSYSTNGGGAWTLGGGISGSWGPNYYDYPENVLTQDRVTGTTFYASNGGGTIWRSANSGQTWTSVGSTSVSAWPQIYSVIGQGGHLFATGTPNANSASGPFQHSIDGGATWTSITGVTGVRTFGVGAAFPGASYPTIYIGGFVSGVYGIYRCTNFNPTTHAGTWTLLSTHPGGIYSNVTAICPDADVSGWIFVGFQGAGTLKMVCNDAAVWGKFSAPAQNATVSGTTNFTVTIAADINCLSAQFQIDGANVGTLFTGPNLTTATLSYNASLLTTGAHVISANLTGNGQTTTVYCYVTR